MAHLNPYAARQIERRHLAEVIAKQKQIKVKSAMRYLQRASAPVGKQRIVHPRFLGISPAIKTKAVKFVQAEIQILQPKGFFERQQEIADEIYQRIKSGEEVFKQLTIVDLKRGDRVSIEEELATLSNLYDNADGILDVDEDLLLRSIRGDLLSRNEQDELQEQYTHFRRDEDYLTDNDIDLDYLDRESIIVHNTLGSLLDLPMANILREAVGNQEVSIDSLEKASALFGELTRSHIHTILEAYNELQNTGSYRCWDTEKGEWIRKMDEIDLDQMFELYLQDGTTVTDVEDSLFWEWFRELFYC